jgi:hypothetical protein
MRWAVASDSDSESWSPPADSEGRGLLRARFDEDPSAVVAFVTTEHFTLQTARTMTVNEANGRASIYLATVSSVIVALAFIGQIAKLGTAFYAFAFVLLPAVFFVGVVTFDRVLQSSIEDGLLAMRINRLRRFYLDFGPGLADYLTVPVPEDEPEAAMRQQAARGGRWQTLLTIAGMVGVINSVVVGVLAALVAGRFVDALWFSVAVGVVVFVVVALAHERRHARVWWAPRPEKRRQRDRT